MPVSLSSSGVDLLCVPHEFSGGPQGNCASGAHNSNLFIDAQVSGFLSSPVSRSYSSVLLPRITSQINYLYSTQTFVSGPHLGEIQTKTLVWRGHTEIILSLKCSI